MPEAPAYRLIHGANWRRVQAAVRELQRSHELLEGGVTLWSGRHLVRTDGSSVDFSLHPPGTVFWATQHLPRSSPLIKQFERRDLPVTACDYPPRKEQASWLQAQLTRRHLPVALAPLLVEQCEGEYARLHLEIDRLALAPAYARVLLEASAGSEALIQAWATGDCQSMLQAVAQLDETTLRSSLSRLLALAHTLYALGHNYDPPSSWLALQARPFMRVPSGWVRLTLQIFTPIRPTQLETVEAICRLDALRRRATRTVNA